MTKDERVPLVSATGSIRWVRSLVKSSCTIRKIHPRTRGNNAIIVTPEADQNDGDRGGIWCGRYSRSAMYSTRRIIIHEDIYDEVTKAIVDAYAQLKIGNPLDEANHVGPPDGLAVSAYQAAIEQAKAEGGKVLVEGGVLAGAGYERDVVKPCIIEAENGFEIVQEETFAPILYLLKYSGDVNNAIALQNGVKDVICHHDQLCA